MKAIDPVLPIATAGVYEMSRNLNTSGAGTMSSRSHVQEALAAEKTPERLALDV